MRCGERTIGSISLWHWVVVPGVYVGIPVGIIWLIVHFWRSRKS
jgi:hypothetical protein